MIPEGNDRWTHSDPQTLAVQADDEYAIACRESDEARAALEIAQAELNVAARHFAAAAYRDGQARARVGQIEDRYGI